MRPFGAFTTKVRCWLCLDAGTVRHACASGTSCNVRTICPNPACEAAADRRSKRAALCPAPSAQEEPAQ